jgi:2-phospho-L-lactate guanylyltransferase
MSPTRALIAIPIKPFGVAKRRLAPILDAEGRSRVGKAVAAHVTAAALATGCPVAVVTADDGVAGWARDHGTSVIGESSPGLNQAAGAALDTARRDKRPWMILHADLPALTPADLLDALAMLPDEGVVLAPSHNGGTSLIAADLDAFTFAYGRASFRRHLATAARLPHRVLIRSGLAIDLDGPHDLTTAIRLPAGRWLQRLISDDNQHHPGSSGVPN